MKSKHLIASLLTAAIVTCSIPAASVISSAAEPASGDVNGDGTFSVLDVVLMQKWLLSVSNVSLQDPEAGDMNADGTLDVFDLALMKRKLLTSTSAEEPSQAGEASAIAFTRSAVTVLDENGNAVSEHPAITVNGQTVTITQPGEYTVSGNSDNGQLVVDVDSTAYPDGKVTLNINGLTLSNPSVAPIYVANIGDECVISVKKGSVNTISDGTSHTDSYTDGDGQTKEIKAAIFARDDLKIKGKGTLIVNGNTADGISTTDDLKLYNGTITVNAVDDGIRGKDSIRIGDADDTDFADLNITVTSTNGDGIKSTNVSDETKGYITFNGGTVSVDAHSDGVYASRDVTVNGGDISIRTYEGSDFEPSASNPGTDPGSNPGWQFPGWGGDNGGGNPGGGWSFPGWGWDDSGHDLGLDFSAKGIKVGNGDANIGGTININGGKVTVNSTDDGLHCGDTLTVNGGELTVATADDALHSDQYLYIQGGKLLVTDSYEGVEAMQIFVKDGDLTIYAYDDALNSGQKDAAKTVHVGNDNCILQIDGGTIHAYVTNNAEGDTIDSNGKIIINGGFVYAEGSVDGPDSAMDSDGEMIVNGGTLVAIGGLGLGEMPVDSSQQCCLYWGDRSNKYQSGSVIKLLDANGTELLSYTAAQAFKSAIISSADVKKGAHYQLTVDGKTVAEYDVNAALTKQGDEGSFGMGF